MEQQFPRVHLATIAWAVLTAVLHLLPAEHTPRMPQPGDKLGHLVLFLVLAYLAFRSFTAVRRLRWPLTTAVLAAIIYGALLELAQGTVSHRQAEWWDLVADVVGIGIFLAAKRLWIGHRSNTFGST